MAIASGQASTLEQIAARLQELKTGARDVSQLPLVTHGASGLVFRAAPMARADYEAYQNLRFIEEKQHEESGALERGAPVERKRSDAWLLEHAICDENGQNLSPELATLLMEGEGFGPSTHTLCEAAAAQNPPRTQLVSEIGAMWGFCRQMVVFMRVVKEANLTGAVLDFMAGTESEKERAQSDLAKIEDTLPFWESVFEARDAAKEIEVEVYEGG